MDGREKRECAGRFGNSVGSAKNWPLRATAIVLLLLVGSLGCGPVKFITYMLTPEQTIPAEFSLTKKKKSVKAVLVVTHANAQTQTSQLFDVDQQLARALTAALKERFKETGEDVKLVSPTSVQEYKARNYNSWQFKTPGEIGKHFDADYVINLEINKIKLFEPNTQPPMYRGRARILVKVTSLNDSEEEGFSKDYVTVYPKNNPLQADFSLSHGDFRNRFVAHMARDLTRIFTHYAADSRFKLDNGFEPLGK